MAGLPTVQVLLDDGTGTFPYDITGFAQLIQGYEVTRGRQDEQSSPSPGQIKGLTLDNTDGRFTVGSTIIASPSPIVANRRIRVKLTANATTVNRFTGYVQQWPVTFPDGSDQVAFVPLVATDAQARAERWTLKSVIEQEITKDSPKVYYTLGDPAAAKVAAESSGNQAPVLIPAGSGAAVVFGSATGPGTDGLTAATFANGQYLQGSNGVPTGTIAGFLCAFSTTTPPASGTSLLLSVVPGQDLISINTSGQLVGPAGLVSAATVTDGATHVATVRYSGTTVFLLLDGVAVASTASGLAGLTVSQIQVGQLYTGAVAHVALFSADPGATRSAAYATAMLSGFAGESGTARLTRLAGYANLPIGTLDASLTNIAFKDFTGKSVAEALRDVADAEGGLLFVDGSGNLMFHNRNRPVAKTAPDVTIDANFLDEGTAFLYDMQGVLNHFEAAALGTPNGAQIIDDLTSRSAHGKYSGSASYLVLTDQEALDRGNWIVSNHAQPAPRVGTLAIDVLTMTAAQQGAMLALEPNIWLRITGLPGQTPGGTTADFIVQGFAEKVTATEWTITANVVNRSLFQAWVLGDAIYSVLGSTTRLYF